jgi:hypothetical protein
VPEIRCAKYGAHANETHLLNHTIGRTIALFNLHGTPIDTNLLGLVDNKMLVN